jgi:hypothetical protein
MQSRRRSRLIRIGSTVGVLIAAGLVAWGFSRGDDDRAPDSSTPVSPTIGVIQQPASVNSTIATTIATQVPVSAPSTEDVPTIPPGTVDVPLPPSSSDIATTP